jgi:hypothetical protein
MVLERPRYRILVQDGDFELRAYDDYLVAETTVRGPYDSALTEGFRILADYIFGNNRSSEHIAMTAPVTGQRTGGAEKIAMTVPVTAQSQGEDTYHIAFMMPAKYTMESLPRPVNTGISFRRVPGHHSAVIRFSGSLNESSGTKHLGELRQWMRNHTLEALAAPQFANYSPPWIPPFFRHNEILVEVSDRTH